MDYYGLNQELNLTITVPRSVLSIEPDEEDDEYEENEHKETLPEDPEYSKNFLQICTYLLKNFERRSMSNASNTTTSSLKMPIDSIDDIPVCVVLKTSKRLINRHANNLSTPPSTWYCYESILSIDSKKIIYEVPEFNEYINYYVDTIHTITSMSSKLDINYFIEVVKIFKEMLHTIHFNKFLGRFCCGMNYDSLGIEWKHLIGETMNSNIKCDFDVCCVCHETTQTKTQCKHYLCYSCWEQIKVNCNDDEIYPCPICRNKCL